MARERVKAPSEKAGCEKVYEGVNPESLHEGVVEDDLGNKVGEVPLRERLYAHEARAKRVEEYLERPA